MIILVLTLSAIILAKFMIHYSIFSILHRKKGVFPDSLRIAKVTSVFKAGEKENLSNYRPISVLPWFSKILGRIMIFMIICKIKHFFTLSSFVFKKAILQTSLSYNQLTKFVKHLNEMKLLLEFLVTHKFLILLIKK